MKLSVKYIEKIGIVRILLSTFCSNIEEIGFRMHAYFFSFFRKELDAATSKTPEGPDVPIIGATSMPHPIWYLF